MSSKRRLRRKSCESKIRHPDKTSAILHLKALQRKTDDWLVVYHCKFCKGWHVGHPTHKRKLNIIACYKTS
jgi:hypothetical protein